MEANIQPPRRLPKSKSLASYDEWKRHELRRIGSDSEIRGTSSPASNRSARSRSNSVSGSSRVPPVIDEDGLLEYATCELRIHPPEVRIDNELDDESTVVIVDSANRPGTLVEVVQNLTELGLSVCRAQISSDGGWFCDAFYVQDALGHKVQDARTLQRIRNILDLSSPDVSLASSSHGAAPGTSSSTTSPGWARAVGMNVVEAIAEDRPGLLAELSAFVNELHLGIYDTMLWAHHGFAAVLFALSPGDGAGAAQPLRRREDLVELEARIRTFLERAGEDAGGSSTNGERKAGARPPCMVNATCCFDTIGLEKRFYNLKMEVSAPIILFLPFPFFPFLCIR